MTRLISIQFVEQPSAVGFGRLDSVTLDAPEERVRGWRLSIRGASVFLVSPAGWANNIPAGSRDPSGPRRVYEIPRSSCLMQWEIAGDEAVDSLQKYDSAPFDRPSVAVPISDEELERATAPKVARK